MKIRAHHIPSILITLLLAVFVACDSSDPGLCFESDTPLAERDVLVAEFSTLRVNQNVSLILSEGDQAIRIEAPEGIIDDVRVEVVNGELLVEDESRCDFFRESAPTNIYVTAPDITRIRNASQYEVRSAGVLSYPELTLVSDNLEGAVYSIGDFRLSLDVQFFEVITGNSSNYYISGNAEEAIIGFYDGLGRFEGDTFLVEDLFVVHRGSNKMIVNPLKSIKGRIVSVGDVIAKNRPETVEVEERFEGRLIFE